MNKTRSSEEQIIAVLLGLAMGATNMIGWALLPALAQGLRGYGVYTMASKLALGAACLAVADGLGRVPTFAPEMFAGFAVLVGSPARLRRCWRRCA